MTTKGDVMVAVSDYAQEAFGERAYVPGDAVPASGNVVYPEDVVALVETVLRGWYTEHKMCRLFEKGLTKVVGKTEATLCNSGSSANLLAVTGLCQMKPWGKYVITCATGFPTTVAPIYQNGRIPIYIDIDPCTLSPDMRQLHGILSDPRFREEISGVILAHTLGFPYDEWEVFDELYNIDAWFVADACDALGAQLSMSGERAHVGTLADAVTFSFFPAHQIMAGEGGAVLTSNPDVHKVIQSLSNWGRDCYCAPGQSNSCGKRFGISWDTLPDGWDHKYTFSRLGYNLKMTEFQAALGLSQLQKLDEFVRRRNQNYSYLYSGLQQYDSELDFVIAPLDSFPSPFGFPITVRDPQRALPLITYLEQHKVSTRRVFGGNLVRQPGFANLDYVSPYELVGSDLVMNQMFWIGVQPSLHTGHLDYVLDVFGKFFNGTN